MSTKKNSTARTGSAKDTSEVKQFIHHLGEAMRIARRDPNISARLYNDLADAWNDFLNEFPSLAEFQESEAYMQLAADTYAKQIAEKGGAR